MVKILHAADFHLDSVFSSLRPEQARQRRQESRQEVRRLVDYANSHGVELMLLSGDLFDSEGTFCETGETLCEALGTFTGPVVIAPGNHDYYTPRSAYARLVWPDNVHIFTHDSVEQIDFPDLACTVYGAAFTAEESSAQVLSGFSVPKDGKTHLMVLHGDTDSPGGPYRPLTKETIAATGLDYLALGHIHQYRGVQKAGNTAYAYPGCLMGRGFDELGEKGFLTGTVDTGSAALQFVPFARRRYQICSVDVTDQTALAAAEQTLPSDTQNDSYRLVFTGETEEELSLPALLHALEDRFYSLDIRDETRMKQDIWRRAGEDSLRGLFLREMYEKFRQADEPEKETIEKAVRLGLAAMDGRDL